MTYNQQLDGFHYGATEHNDIIDHIGAIEGLGFYPAGAAGYSFFKVGDTYYVIDTKTKEEYDQGSTLRSLIESVVADADRGERLFFYPTPTTSSYYDIDGLCTLDKGNITVVGSGGGLSSNGTYFRFTDANARIVCGDASTTLRNIIWENCRFEPTTALQASMNYPTIKFENMNRSGMKHCRVQHNTGDAGVCFDAGDGGGMDNFLVQPRFYDNDINLKFTHSGSYSSRHFNQWGGRNTAPVTDGLLIEQGTGTGSATHMHRFWGTEWSGGATHIHITWGWLNLFVGSRHESASVAAVVSNASVDRYISCYFHTNCTLFQITGDHNFIGSGSYFGSAAIISDSGTGNVFPDVRLFRTKTHGTRTIQNGTTSRTVLHNLDYTPLAQDIHLHPIETLGAATHWWVDTITATHFTINLDVNPGQDVDFAYTVERSVDIND